MRLVLAAAALFALGACDTGNPLVQPGPALNETQREFLFPVVPFQEGPISVVTEERGEMRTYLFNECRGGARICAGSPHGPVVHLTDIDGDGMAELRAHGRHFRLVAGGTGTLVRHGHESPLAWE